MTRLNRDREDAYEALMSTALRKYDGPMGTYGPTLDTDRGLLEWAAALSPPRRMKGVDLWWEYEELISHTDREYGSFVYGPVLDRQGALEEEIKRRVSANDALFGSGQLPNGDMHICVDEGPCESPYCDNLTPAQQKAVAGVVTNVVLFPGKGR
jgi:hypothetical protein